MSQSVKRTADLTGEFSVVRSTDLCAVRHIAQHWSAGLLSVVPLRGTSCKSLKEYRRRL